MSAVVCNRSRARARALPARALASAITLTVFAAVVSGGRGEDLMIEVPSWAGAARDATAGDATVKNVAVGDAAPGDIAARDAAVEDAAAGWYRLDYRPPQGEPAPNTTLPARAAAVRFRGLPGTTYHFMLYYSNATVADLLAWNTTITTAPEPPAELTATVRAGRSEQAAIAWSPPASGGYTGFHFKVVPPAGTDEVARDVSAQDTDRSLLLRELTPGATYQLRAFTLLHSKESAAYTYNFTTKPNTPGKIYVWFRNETSLLALWQPPFPPGIFTHYKVSIEPPDALVSDLYIEKEGDPPGPAQAGFKGLVPGRAYNVSVQTVSDAQRSAPATAQCRTVPRPPRNISVELAETALRVSWRPPDLPCEFEQYQILVTGDGCVWRMPEMLPPMLRGPSDPPLCDYVKTTSGKMPADGGGRRRPAVLRARSEPPTCIYDQLKPGAHYRVTIKTISGKVKSLPASVDVTLRPLPVHELRATPVDGALTLMWDPAEGSTQDEYRVTYYEVGSAQNEIEQVTAATELTLSDLLPGRNYSLGVAAVSRGVASNVTWSWAATRPLSPVLRHATTSARVLTLVWISGVNSHQDKYKLRYRRRGDSQPYRTLETTGTNVTLEELVPGAEYELQLTAVSHGLSSESLDLLQQVHHMMMWFRNETTLLVLWQPPEPPGDFTHYKVSIEPPDALASELNVEKEVDPPGQGPLQASFKGLVPGRVYNVSVQTVSGAQLSVPTAAQYRTVPLRPRNVSVEYTETAFRVSWRPPDLPSEFEQYQISVADGNRRRLPVMLRARSAPPTCIYDGLEPGLHYKLTVKTMSGKVTSWPVSMDVTLRPLPVRELRSTPAGNTLALAWVPSEGSTQDEYRVTYFEEGGACDGPVVSTAVLELTLSALLPGRNYSLSVTAVSRGVASSATWGWGATRPLPPVLSHATAGTHTLALVWNSGVNSHQDKFKLRYRRRGDSQSYRTMETTGTNVTLEELAPGAVYELQLTAVSHGLNSEPLDLLQPVRPLPPAWLVVERAAPAAARAHWRGPGAGAVGCYLLRYRAPGAAWTRLYPLPPDTFSAEITDMRPGERYIFQLDTGSEHAGGESVDSGHPLSAEHTLLPLDPSEVNVASEARGEAGERLPIRGLSVGSRTPTVLQLVPLPAGGGAL